MKNKTLVLLLLISLLGIWGISTIGYNSSHSFNLKLIAIDTSQVTAMTIHPKSDDQKELILQKENGSWIVTQGNVTTIANTEVVQDVINSLHLIKAKRIATKKQNRWREYEVDEASGSRVQIYAGSKLLEDFIVGRLGFEQQTKQEISFIRLSNSEEVYVIGSPLSKTMRQGFNAYRNKSFLRLNADDITQLSLSQEDSTSLSFIKINEQWKRNGVLIDSTGISHYLSGIQNLSSSDFLDDVDETQINAHLYKTLSIYDNSPVIAPIKITCYQDKNRVQRYILVSSQNEEAYFGSKEEALYYEVFTKLEELDKLATSVPK